jgi:hypothetical protein
MNLTEDALREQMRAYYATELAQQCQDDEFTVSMFMEANGIERKKRDHAVIVIRNAVENGSMTERDGIHNGRATKLYKFAVAKSQK